MSEKKHGCIVFLRKTVWKNFLNINIIGKQKFAGKSVRDEPVGMKKLNNKFRNEIDLINLKAADLHQSIIKQST